MLFHSWNVKPKDAVKIQNSLKEKIILKKDFRKIERIAGIDVSFPKDGKKCRCAIIIYSYPRLEIIEKVTATRPVKFPYIPGLLTFREGPVVLSAYKKIKNKPDILIFDGHGIAHPRTMGIASHMGVLLDKPSIGCAKNLLCGSYKEPSKKKGSFTYIKLGKKIIGAVVRTRNSVKCVFVSIGHRINLEESIKIILKLSFKYRIPEPLRTAHTTAKIQNSVL